MNQLLPIDLRTGALETPAMSSDFHAEDILGNFDVPNSLKIDFPVQFGDRKTQGSVPRCTADALCNAMEIWIGLNLGVNVKLLSADLWDMQWVYPATRKDLTGDYTRSALRACRKFGVLAEDGSIWRVKIFWNIKNDPAQWIQANLMKYPIYTSCPTQIGLESGQRERWTTWTFARIEGVARFGGETIGGHALAQYGLDNPEKLFEFAQSWGDNWGVDKDSTYQARFDDLEFFHKSFVFECEEVTGRNKRFLERAREVWKKKDFWSGKTMEDRKRLSPFDKRFKEF